MNKKLIEYLIIATAIVLLLYGCFSMLGFKYEDLEVKANVTDSIEMYYPSSSEYTVDGNTVEFRNDQYDIYNMDASKISSSDERVQNLLSHVSKVAHVTVDYKNETTYILTMEYEDAKGFKYHSMIMPVDSFDKDSSTFKKETDVILFDGNNRDFVIDAAFNSEVKL